MMNMFSGGEKKSNRISPINGNVSLILFRCDIEELNVCLECSKSVINLRFE
jgi:hypothetical protein